MTKQDIENYLKQKGYTDDRIEACIIFYEIVTDGYDCDVWESITHNHSKQ